ncbi:MAG TPA: ATP-binding protein [Candidatus Polarisedimenticolia bacterium]|nr:ATP-binding protein [Candidatus Polarisedimenticolia bacterium]
MKFNRGLKGKFIFLVSALLITTSMALGWIFLVREVRDSQEKLSQKGIILARNLAANVELGVYTRNHETLANLAAAVLQESDVAFVVILDESDKPLYADAAEGFRAPDLPSLLEEMPSEAPATPKEATLEVHRFRDPLHDDEEVYLASFPVLTRKGGSVGEEIGFLPETASGPGKRREKIGRVLVGLSTRLRSYEIGKLEKALGLATLVVIAIGITLTVLLVRIIVEPVKQLVAATRRIAQGDLDTMLHVNSHDEIGELARSFNQMTLKLQNSRQELERTNQMLEEKVRERTQELEEAQGQLVQAEKMSVVGQLVSGVAHELNNPLAGVLGYSQLLLRMEVPDDVKRGLEKIESEADRCKRIVQNLLIFARKNKPQKRLIDLNGIVESVLELKDYQFRVDNVRVVRELNARLPMTMADSGQLQQVIMNIVHNAQQAMNETEREAVLTVRTWADPASIHLEIADTGLGIPPHHLNRIFDPFFTTKEVGQGTGLGLSICYGVIQEHRGRIWAESRTGSGTIFHIVLPVQGDGAPIRPLEPSAPAPPGNAATSSGATARILVVDDEASIVDILYDVLRLDGHQIETALNGRLALRKLQQQPFDVIISDLRMPGMSGQELFEQMKEMNSALLSRIIFTTGDVASQDTQGFLEKSGSPYLQKPFDLNEVRRLVQEMLVSIRGSRPDLPSLTPVDSRDPDPSA